MARIFNQQENDFLTEMLLNNVKQAWIGGHYQPVFTKNQTFQDWFWIDQKLLSASVPVIYENWKPGRPSDDHSNPWIGIFGQLANKDNGNLPGLWKDFSGENQYNFICEVRCPLGQKNGDLLLDFSGESRSTLNGDPVNDGMGVIPVLPSRFGVNVTAVWDLVDSNSYGYPLNLGRYYICGNGRQVTDPIYGPKIRWYDDGNLYIYFRSPNYYNQDGSSSYEYSVFNFNPAIYFDIDLQNGWEITLQLEIYEDKFYAVNYAINGESILANAMATYDGSICGFSSCDGSNYRQKEQYQVPVSAIGYSTLNADDQGCSYSRDARSTVTTKVQIWSLEDN